MESHSCGPAGTNGQRQKAGNVRLFHGEKGKAGRAATCGSKIVSEGDNRGRSASRFLRKRFCQRFATTKLTIFPKDPKQPSSKTSPPSQDCNLRTAKQTTDRNGMGDRVCCETSGVLPSRLDVWLSHDCPFCVTESRIIAPVGVRSW